MPSITETAQAFFTACETGQGWNGCAAYCTPDASFIAQAEPLLEIRTLQASTDWMQGLMKVLTDGKYEIRSFATDMSRNNVCAYGVFTAPTWPAARAHPPARPLAPTTSTSCSSRTEESST